MCGMAGQKINNELSTRPRPLLEKPVGQLQLSLCWTGGVGGVLERKRAGRCGWCATHHGSILAQQEGAFVYGEPVAAGLGARGDGGRGHHPRSDDTWRRKQQRPDDACRREEQQRHGGLFHAATVGPRGARHSVGEVLQRVVVGDRGDRDRYVGPRQARRRAKGET